MDTWANESCCACLVTAPVSSMYSLSEPDTMELYKECTNIWVGRRMLVTLSRFHLIQDLSVLRPPLSFLAILSLLIPLITPSSTKTTMATYRSTSA